MFHAWFYRMDSIPLARWEIDRRMALRPEIAQSAKRAGQAIHACNLTDDLPKISAPTLGIYGRNEGTVPYADAELLQYLAIGAQLATIENCGHFPMVEQTTGYLEAQTKFLRL
jgi:pimeloyl-ACP methyl ester carboxylesterase